MRILRSRGGGGKEDTASASYTRYDPLLGWSHLAGASGTYRRREYTVEVKINSQGLRDRERSPKPLPGVFRLLALGDSFVEAYTVPQEQGVAPQLESALSLGGCPVEVVNGGVQGYSTDQQYLYWKSAGRSLQPNVVVLFLYHNDILANDMAHYWGTPKPLLVWRRGQLELTTDPVPRREPRAPFLVGARDIRRRCHGRGHERLRAVSHPVDRWRVMEGAGGGGRHHDRKMAG